MDKIQKGKKKKKLKKHAPKIKHTLERYLTITFMTFREIIKYNGDI